MSVFMAICAVIFSVVAAVAAYACWGPPHQASAITGVIGAGFGALVFAVCAWALRGY
jgi:hypothetical protein